MFASSLVLAASFASTPAAAPLPPIHALLITGHNNHNWQYTSRVHKETLEGTGRFVVDITDDPATTLASADLLKQYQVFVLDYNDSQAPKRWGDAAEKNFAAAVQGGVGICAIHAADNAFNGWKEYEQMLGLMWREGTGHGAYHEFNVAIVDKDHPITKGLSDFKMHPDELYHKLVNSQKTTPHLLMQAMDDGQGGSNQIEPMAFTLEFGKGRIFATPLGHVWTNDQKSKKSVLDGQFKVLVCRGAEWAATGAVTLGANWSDVRTHNTLSGDDMMMGWKLLFDGTKQSVDANWRGYKGEKFPEKGWSVQDGALVHAKGGEGGDVLTKMQYGDFEFECQWKVAKGGNSGIMYHVTEDHDQPYETGPEMQILDDEAHSTSAKKNMAGSFYDMFPCMADTCRPAGEWNTSRILVKGPKVQFFLNGVKVVDVDCTSEEYKKALGESKWKTEADFNTRAKGFIDLQNHGDEVWFRDLKVREVK